MSQVFDKDIFVFNVEFAIAGDDPQAAEQYLRRMLPDLFTDPQVVYARVIT